jgi:hypothetical protein
VLNNSAEFSEEDLKVLPRWHWEEPRDYAATRTMTRQDEGTNMNNCAVCVRDMSTTCYTKGLSAELLISLSESMRLRASRRFAGAQLSHTKHLETVSHYDQKL